ncbi:SUMO-activating enzyme subunit 1-like [Biomphalaria glabrata]|uniref:SUMO-activating enzyme subunit 1 n=1 Tax=Biomphalaria glabrata TaxID=6526 RepID=A0A9U8ECM4_BIOGL|nr:SUMO-activating enzyme subunit 1-like [Biomphalaria glabrata]
MDSQSSMDLITEDEAELYDRQIRLWGLDAQRRLRAASVLLIGLKGLGAEVAKNIILSGIKAITLMDHNPVDEEDQMSQFFVSTVAPGQNRAEASASNAQLLNPMVTVTTDTNNPAGKDDNFFKEFDVICATCCPPSLLCRLDKLCFENNIKFFAGDVYGYYGFTFSDLGTHEYLHEEVKVLKPKEGEGQSKTTEKTITSKEKIVFTRLEDELQFDWTADTPAMQKKIRQTPSTFFITRVYQEFLEVHGRRPCISSLEADTKELQNIRLQLLNKLGVPAKVIPEDFYKYGFGELSPVCAIVGGILGQEIIKAVSQKDAPLNNFFFYNGVTDDGLVDKITL